MYFLSRGTVVVVINPKFKIDKVAPNYFGEVALFCKTKRTADVIAFNFCTVECITRIDLNKVCDT